ncbi:long-chain acyl-CoA synthetase [Amycolatopsis jiangsuensis]|uniref:Long-chain acyl-CoA synthetase n=1 Tax=Amycolatopsis jiangsuensis TaxID=1181879 RepID=A0A840J7L4_9PSEU|nr:long-chain acyl-CoA synthetase [Amycolatopsis jiangsuensis]
MLMRNRPELLEGMYAAFKAGMVIVPLNATLSATEVAYHLRNSGAAVLITDEHGAAEAGDVGVSVVATGEQYEGLLAEYTHKPPKTVDVGPETIAWLFYTSGATGRPKGAMLTHGGLAFIVASWLADLTPMDEHDVTLHAAPLSHGAGFHALAAVARGAHQVIPTAEWFDPREILELMRRTRVTNTWLVPTQITMLSDYLDGADPQLPHLRHVVYGGAPFPPTEFAAAVRAFGPVLVQLYGPGEAPMTISWLPAAAHPEPDGADVTTLRSAGWPRPGMDVRIVDPETGAELGTGEVGEVTAAGPAVMAGYWKRPDETAKTLHDGWLHTGDLGSIDEHGRLFLLDRSKDLIITGGSNVYAVEVERALLENAGVAEVAVIGTPDRTWGETVTAVVVPAGEQADELPEELAAHARVQLASYKVPWRFELVDVIPRNAHGNVDKRALRERFNRP